MPPRPAKIFGIGLHKTGTTTLGKALQTLGYTHRAHAPKLLPAIQRGDWRPVMRKVRKYDSFADTPWPLLFRELDERVPGAKFILTLRDPDAWYRSLANHAGERSTPMREWIYGPGNGSPAGREAIYKARFAEHNAAVQAYFAGRPADLLVIDLTAAPRWDELCAFLGLPVPPEPFPHYNQASYDPAEARGPSGWKRWRRRLRGKR